MKSVSQQVRLYFDEWLVHFSWMLHAANSLSSLLVPFTFFFSSFAICFSIPPCLEFQNFINIVRKTFLLKRGERKFRVFSFNQKWKTKHSKRQHSITIIIIIISTIIRIKSLTLWHKATVRTLKVFLVQIVKHTW